MAKVGFDVGASKIPDDVTLLKSLVDSGSIVATPPQVIYIKFFLLIIWMIY